MKTLKNILITGSNGQLGSEFRQIADNFPDFGFYFTDIEELDICDKNAVDAFVACNSIDYIVNCAAYTAVDKAESNEEICYKLNCDAVRNLGEAAKSNNARIIHISTDYVFDGSHHRPYTETDKVAPMGVYGKSKLAGEQALQNTGADAVIIRTAWLYSSFGNNFVKTMLRLGRERETLNVVFDQIGTPTCAADLCQASMQIISSGKWTPGLYHFSNEGVCSWYDFTKAIHRLADISCKVFPVESKDFPTPSARPHYSVLNKAKIKSTFGIEIPHWEESLAKIFFFFA